MHLSSATTPWIAFISCDANVTKTTDVDVFTLAKARGALAAVIYSQWSDACILNSAFANPAIFSAPLDVYATKSLIAARFVSSMHLEVAV
ncbi:hypothetical protein SCHPADRAFT_826617 [Schizopora paradoxa]|uniref:PA domain-containing protein n=1 Tax=Schizopora paradoxa TaxID=27342 RepID=A0A0H2RXQ7_9AGAM|nr:hypothetical protein SCHPADRAFT_826617 [Schizopora paradoxa]